MKKAQGLSTQTIVLIALGLLFLVLTVGILTGQFRLFGQRTEALSPSSTQLCFTKGLTTAGVDIDKDNLPDDCDNCVCADGCANYKVDPLAPTKITQARDDDDKDGLPNFCDKDPKDNTKKEWSDVCTDLTKVKTGGFQCKPS